ncbi:MAG: PQQ-like beta-propeller repeat protein [Planctomycetia bacterium]|nr:MAG: PQQ-like beta-propeller repeat protein [Planctomycetia bacterium]
MVPVRTRGTDGGAPVAQNHLTVRVKGRSRERMAVTNAAARSTAARGRAVILVGLLVLAPFVVPPAEGQVSGTSWWPKFQRDVHNRGAVPLASLATDVHVRWQLHLSAPIVGENYSTPVFSPDNRTLYVGGSASTLSAVAWPEGVLRWQTTLGDATGVIHMSPVVGIDGAIYAGSWDAVIPYDGFARIRDIGASGTVDGAFAMRRALAGPTITSSGLVVVGGQHPTDGWRYYALESGASGLSLNWTAALLANPSDPASTGRIGAAPALSVGGGTAIFGSSDQNRTFWRISATDGAEEARIAMGAYCFSGTPAVSSDGYVFVGEGQDFAAPSDSNEGRLHVFGVDAQGVTVRVSALALGSGHLNGGLALRELPAGRTRVYVAANGNGKATAKLIAVDFDPALVGSDPPVNPLSTRWETPIGGSAFAYPHPVVGRDGVVYVIGPANHTLYAVRDTDAHADAAARGEVLWSMRLADISAVAGWAVASQRGPWGAVVGPDGRVLWNAPDGYLYALDGWRLGDLDGDGDVDAADVLLLEGAADDSEEFAIRFPEVDLMVVGDLDGDGEITVSDVERLAATLAGP